MHRVARSFLFEMISSAVLGTILFTFVLFLQRVSRLFEQLVRGSAPPDVIAFLFVSLLPPALTFTIPVGILVGALIALNRMSADSEITALRASGVSSRTLMTPVLLVGFLGTAMTAAASLWLTPLAVRQTYKLLNQIAAAQLTAEIQPNVFEEQFPNTILYVGEVVPGRVVRWRKIFMADVSPPDQRKAGPNEAGAGPSITIASEAIATPDVERNRLQLSLVNGSTHVAGKQEREYYSASFPSSQQILEAGRRIELRPRLQYTAMDIGPLWRATKTSLDARIELHQRLVLPPACLLLGLLALPMGTSTRKGGKGSAFVLTVAIAFLYQSSLIMLIGLARQGTLPAGIALWLPNVALLIIALFGIVRLERPGDRDIIGSIRGSIDNLILRLRGNLPTGGPSWGWRRLPLGPQIIDHYVLSGFIFYFVLLLVSFVLMTQMFTFFELLGDILRNNIPMALVAKYLFFLTPMLIYTSTPVSVLVAVLVTFGVLTKNNEITAMKACGVSLYRLSVPVLLMASVLSGSLFAFDHYVIPDANRTQDAIRNQIKGRPVQTYLRPDRKWIFGSGSRIYYYRYFDPAESVMVDVNVFELDPATFGLRRHIAAERARWEPSMKKWIFQNGWRRDFRVGHETDYLDFLNRIATFPELQEPPSYFLKEVKQDKQMNFRELEAYIRELKQSGFETVRLQVQLHKKFSVPLFALIMALISIPFAFIAAHRGAMAGIGVSFGLAIAYWAINQLFEQVGNVNQLPAAMAAWSPDAVFSLAGLYFMARLRT